MKMAVLAALPILLSAAVVHAQRPGTGNPVDVGKLPESGPAVVGGTGATAGPNSKNQALSPMPGLRDEELSERPPDAALRPLPEIRPIPGPARKQPATPTR
jgi:hypothetical protein